MLDAGAPVVTRQRPDPVVAVAVVLLAVTALGLALGGILAVYDWRTPEAERPLMWTVIVVFFASLGLLVLGAAIRWARARVT